MMRSLLPIFRLSPRPPLRKSERGSASLFLLLAMAMGCGDGQRPAPSAAQVADAPAVATSVDSVLQQVDTLYARYRTIQAQNDSVPSWLVLVRINELSFAPWVRQALEGAHRDQLAKGSDGVMFGFDWFTGSAHPCEHYAPGTRATVGDTLFLPLLCVQGRDTASEANIVLALRRVSYGWRIDDVGYLDGSSLLRMLSDYYQHGE